MARALKVAVGLALLAVLGAGTLLLRGCSGTSPPVERPAGGSRVSPSEAAPPAPAPPTTDLEGWAVRRGTVEPLPVAVAVTLGDGTVLRGAAGADGRFRLAGLPRGSRVDAAITSPGLAATLRPGLAVPGTGTLDLGMVVLGEGRALAARVLLVEGGPAAGALLLLRQAPAQARAVPVRRDDAAPWPVVARAEADGGGRAAFPSLAPDRYRVEASAPGKALAVQELLVRADRDPEPVDLVLGPGAALDVEVTDGAGLPAAGARVRATWGVAVVEAIAGADGACRLEGLAPGSVVIEALLPSGATAGGNRVAVPAGDRIRLACGSRETLRGRVRDAGTGTGIAGAVVTAIAAPPFAGSSGRTDTESGADGAFSLPSPGGTGVLLLVAARDHLDGRWNIGGGRPDSLLPGEPLDLRLPRARTIRGTVRGEDGSPVPGAHVQLAQATGPGGFSVGAGAQVLPDGTFVLGGARTGPAMVKVTATGWWQPGYPVGRDFMVPRAEEFPPACSVVVPEEGACSIDILLRRGGTVSGILVDAEGRPGAGLILNLAAEGGASQGTALSAPDGTFAFHGIPPGRGYSLSLAGGTGSDPLPPAFDIPDGSSVEGLRRVVPRGASVHGVVLDAAGGPVAGAEVRSAFGTAASHSEFGPPGGSGTPSATSAADGTFRIAGLRGFPQQVLLVRHEGYAEGAAELAGLVGGEERGPVEIRLRPESRIRGVVTDEEGRPVPGAMVAAKTGVQTTDREGRFDLAGLEAGPQRINVAAPGYVPEYPTVEGVEVRIPLHRARTLEGRVVRAGTEEPVAGVMVVASGTAAPSHGTSTSDARGRFRIAGLRPGVHDLQVLPSGTWLPPSSSKAEPGAAPVTLELEPGFPLAGRVLDAEGGPVAGARVGVGASPEKPRESTMTDANGSFRFRALPAGPTGVFAWPPGWRRGGERTGALLPAERPGVEAGREDVEIRLVAGVDLRGRIVDVTERLEHLALSVGAVPSGEGKPLPGTERWVKAERDGTFLFPGLDPGRTYDLLLHGERAGVGGFLRAARPGAGEATLLLGPGLALAGRVFDAGGAPLRGLQVRAEAIDARGPEDGTRGEDSTDAEGAFSMVRLGEFRFRVSVRTGGTEWAPAAVEAVAAEGRILEFRLLPGAAIEGRVAGTGEGPLAVIATPAGGPESGGTSTRVREDGTFRISGLAPGPHRVKVADTRRQGKSVDGGVVEAPAAGVELRFE